jgi:Ferredoxin-thioredoxin reductase, catalytic subunit
MILNGGENLKFAMTNLSDTFSKEAVKWFIENDPNLAHLKNINIDLVYPNFIANLIYPQHSPILVACIEALGEKAFDSKSPKISPRILDIEVTDKYLVQNCNGRRYILPKEQIKFNSINSQPDYSSLNSRTMIFSKSGNILVMNPNTELVDRIYFRIKNRNGHCPCTTYENEDTICPCKEVRVVGKCHCGLYIDLIEP